MPATSSHIENMCRKSCGHARPVDQSQGVSQAGERGPIDPQGGSSEILVIREGVDGVLEGYRAAWQSHDLPPRGPLSWLSQQTRAARASHQVATAKVGASAKDRCRSKSAVCCGNSSSGATILCLAVSAKRRSGSGEYQLNSSTKSAVAARGGTS
jgi:hypothetical protein